MIRQVAGWICSITLGMLVVGPLAALGVCALVDLAPGGPARTSLFSVAVSALDPFLWTSLRASTTVAGATAAAALVGGVLIGRLVDGLRGWSLTIARGALGLAAATPPTIITVAAAMVWAVPPGGAGGLVVWWGASAFPAAAAGAAAYLAASRRLAPSCGEAAKLASGGSRTWRRLVWPLLRPPMARVAAFAFAWTLVDPGPPLILGLRRTLGYQMVLSAIGEDPFPRLAVLGLIAILACAIVRGALRLWAGSDPDHQAPARDDRPDARPAGSRLQTAAAWLSIGATVALPAVVLTVLLRSAALQHTPGTPAETFDLDLGRLLFRSLGLGAAVAAAAAATGRVAARLEAGAGAGVSQRFRRLSRLLAPPPIVAGILVLSLGRLIRLAGAITEIDVRGFPIDEAASWVEGRRAPLMTAIVAVWLSRAAGGLGRPLSPRSTLSEHQADAALLVGAGKRRARRLGRRTKLADGPSMLAVAISAAANITPALLVLATLPTATLGPAVLLLQEQPGGASATAQTALIVWGACVVAAGVQAFGSTRATRRA